VKENISSVHVITSSLADEHSHVCCLRAFDLRRYHISSNYYVTGTDRDSRAKCYVAGTGCDERA
jgi:hypothetical protein